MPATSTITEDEIRAAVEAAFPGSKLNLEKLTLGHRKLQLKGAKEPHWKIRVIYATRAGLDEVAGCALVPESGTQAQLKKAIDELDGMRYAGIEAAEQYAEEQRRFNAQKKRLGGKRDDGEAMAAIRGRGETA